MSRSLLHFTLEIIFLLSGEVNASTFPSSLSHYSTNLQVLAPGFLEMDPVISSHLSPYTGLHISEEDIRGAPGVRRAEPHHRAAPFPDP
ncbi:hypothetical protein GDO81_002810 [Engystomops pustulosus]|uniref:Uncharacterized protein n=1 Tax=Engystomops pustulosus TaxID=76066 RepID=A0AAV7DSH9_ENGPU|nr:hypothetical protein GDO81_002810 [Engystomops pustulosus]